MRPALPKALLAALLLSPLAARAQTQTLAELYQALPVADTLQAWPDGQDSSLVWRARPLRVRVRRQLDSLLHRSAGPPSKWLGEAWQQGRLFRVAGADCPYLVLAWEDILSSHLITLTPTFRVLDAREAATFEPPYWRAVGRRFVGRSDYMDATALTCHGFRTTAVTEQFYSVRHPGRVMRRVVTEYRISAAGRITAVPPPPTPARSRALPSRP